MNLILKNMKKISFFAVGLLLLAACQKEAIVSESGTTGEYVTISAQLPESMTSRTIGDGTTVNRCILEIYQDGSLLDEGRKVVQINENKATFQAKLTNGEDYQLVLWADYSLDSSTDTYYDTDSPDGLKNISRITDTYVGNNDQLDAFFASETFTASATSTNIELKRPFAQLNIYASDLDYLLTDDVKPSTVSVTFNSVYTSFNAVEGTVGTEVSSLSYSKKVAIIGENAQMSYDYLFAPDTESTLNDFTMHFYNAAGVELPSYSFTNIPIQRNYRTHVTGNLQTVDASLSVVIQPDFEETLTKDIYDGHSVVEPDLIGTTYDIKSAANLVYIMQNLNLCAGKTLDIQCDMDFVNANINSYVATFNGSASINVNGNGKTIENLVLNGGNSIGGFIPEMGSGTIKDLTFDNLTVKVDTDEDAYVGGIVGRVFGNLVITNCNVLNSSIAGVNKIGGIVGFVTADARNIEITSCRVENTTISGETLNSKTQAGDCGGIVGYIESPNATITGNYVLNSTLSLANVMLTDDQFWGRGMSLYVGTCRVVEGANIVISADADATQGSKRVINGTEDGGLVRYQGLLGNIRSKNLPTDATLTINGTKVEAVDTSTEKNPVE